MDFIDLHCSWISVNYLQPQVKRVFRDVYLLCNKSPSEFNAKCLCVHWPVHCTCMEMEWNIDQMKELLCAALFGFKSSAKSKQEWVLCLLNAVTFNSCLEFALDMKWSAECIWWTSGHQNIIVRKKRNCMQGLLPIVNRSTSLGYTNKPVSFS